MSSLTLSPPKKGGGAKTVLVMLKGEAHKVLGIFLRGSLKYFAILKGGGVQKASTL